MCEVLALQKSPTVTRPTFWHPRSKISEPDEILGWIQAGGFFVPDYGAII